MRMPRVWRALALIGVAALTACLDATGSAGARNSIRLVSDPGDALGAGKSYEYTQATAVIGVDNGGIPPTLTINVAGDENWVGFFSMPSGMTRIAPGTYREGLNWHGGLGGIACRTATGSFTIDRVTYDSMNVTAVDLRFEQHCDSAAAALHGTIHWRVSDPTRPPGPVNPPPADLWRPPSGAMPAGVNAIYLESDSGDPVGQGGTHLFTTATATLTLVGSGGSITFNVTNPTWSGDFWRMTGIPQFAVGYYPGLRGIYFANPAKGAISVSGPGGVCNILTGWFVIDHITFAQYAVTELDMRFEQHCNGAAPALRGAVHWTQ